MSETPQPLTGRVYSVLLATVTAHVVVQAEDVFLEAFIPRSEAENLRVGRQVVASPSANGTTIRMV